MAEGKKGKGGAEPKRKEDLLEEVLSQVKKKFGEEAILNLGESISAESLTGIETISTGSIGIDYITGIGGLPRGRVVEIFGPEGSGKTTLALQVIAQAQRKGGFAAFIDAEHAMDRVYASALGVVPERLFLVQPDSGDQALEILDMLVRGKGGERAGPFDVIVVDSVAALVPRAELEGQMGDAQIGLQARLMSQALRKLTANIGRSRSLVIFLNQIRMKVATGYGSFGPSETTTGGYALKFYASMRIELKPAIPLKHGQEHYGRRIKVKVVKNKLAPPFRTCEVDLIYGKGTSRVTEIINYGEQLGIIERTGSWYSYEGRSLGQGRQTVERRLLNEPELMSELESKVVSALWEKGEKLELAASTGD
ncbi:MAG TPA: recombinase RecA [Proteobacteria bacterium]|nr:recombinase RecA [Pseudomonadota bacterium]